MADEQAEHVHQRDDVCCCGIVALEPAERCPVHGIGTWPPRCVECGQFMPYPAAPEQPEEQL